MSKSYVAAVSGFILGTWYEKGAKVPVTEAQAKYLAPPYGDALKAESAKTAARAASSTKSEKAGD